MDTLTFEALADPNRAAILQLLAARGELCLCDIASALDLSSALASHHVKKLRAAGLVATVRRGTWLHCALNASTLHAAAAELTELAESASSDAPAACCCPAPREVGPDDV